MAHPEKGYSEKKKIIGTRLHKSEKKIAYFSMEIGLESKMPTYSGGLGILAGDTIKSCADLNIPIVAVTILYKKGYFHQKLDENGQQQELPVEWLPKDFSFPRHKKVTVNIEGRKVLVQGWEYRVVGIGGGCVPVIFLDTDIEENSEYDRALSYSLYG